MHTLPLFDHVRRDLTAHLYAFAHVIDSCIRPGDGVGSTLLSLPNEGMLGFPAYDAFDLSVFPFAKDLQRIYRYAERGEAPTVKGDVLSIDPDEGSLGRIKLLLDILAVPEILYCIDDVTDAFDTPDNPREGLPQVIELAVARATLDEGFDVTTKQVALLAQVSEKTVANAMAMKGEDGLPSVRKDGCTVVDSKDAERWLSTRRGYLRTVSLGSMRGVPDRLDAADLGPFLANRFSEYVSDSSLDLLAFAKKEVKHIPSGQRVPKLARTLGIPETRVQPWVDGNVQDIALEDCEGIAKQIGLDPRWLSQQIVDARFPLAKLQLDISLTESGIRGGYFDIDQRFARQFFPEDAFGGRSGDEVGETVRLHVDGATFETDIRVKSQALVSPRKRFTAYFKAHKAKPGDRLRLRRLGERDIELQFVGE